jgi:hypothetical protein
MTPRVWSVVNVVVVAAVVGWNFWTARFGLAGRTVGGMSDVYDTLFTPAGYAFSIWGFIFLGLVANAVYQLWLAFAAGPAADAALEEHRRAFFTRLGPLLILANLANCLWTVLWLTEQTAASVVVLASMFALLTLALHRLDMERWDAPFEVIGLVWWPLAIYTGWVTVAVLANLSAFLAKHGVVPGDSEAWAVAMIAVATAYNVALVALRNLREHALVAIWAAIAIAVRQWGNVASVQWTAVAAAAILGAVVTAHAFYNRRTLPLVRRWL